MQKDETGSQGKTSNAHPEGASTARDETKGGADGDPRDPNAMSNRTQATLD